MKPANRLLELINVLRFWAQIHRRARSSVRILKYFPDVSSEVKLLSHSSATSDSLPVPPEKLWLGYGSNEASYLESGRRDIQLMLKALKKVEFTFNVEKNILDFGCGGGRLIRHLEPFSKKHHIWGCDISAAHIHWLKANLQPTFRFFLHTTIPHLPFPDRSIDLIYAGSVFTHIDDFGEAWLLELGRILRPGGKAWITIHDERTIEQLFSPDCPYPFAKYIKQFHELRRLSEQQMIAIGEDADGQVFHSESYFRTMTERIFNIQSIIPQAWGLQTAYLLQRNKN